MAGTQYSLWVINPPARAEGIIGVGVGIGIGIGITVDFGFLISIPNPKATPTPIDLALVVSSKARLLFRHFSGSSVAGFQ